MSSTLHKVPPPPSAIVIFGANGDLTKRLIVPALYNLAKTKLLPERFALIGVDHNDKGVETWRDGLRDFLQTTLKKGGGETEIDPTFWNPICRIDVLCRRRLPGSLDLQQIGGASGRTRQGQQFGRQCPVLSGGRRPVFRTCDRRIGQSGTGGRKDQLSPRDHREALRARSAVCQGAEHAHSEMAARGPDFSHRPFSWQGDGAEHYGVALCQRIVRADLESRPHRPCADHGGRIHRHGRARTISTSRPARCATWCPTICSSSSR